MNNYSHFSSQSNKTFQNGPILNIVLVLCVILVFIGVIMLSTQDVPYC